MAIKVNGKDMKDAVIKTQQFDLKILDLTPDAMKFSIKDNSNEAFNFVTRFISVAYPENKVINVKDAGILVIPAKGTVQGAVQFEEKLRLEMLISFELRYARKRLAEISVE